MSCLICDESGTASARGTSTEVIKQFTKQLGVQGHGSDVILCEDCLSGVVRAVERKEEVGEVERDVRSLQRIILKMMRQLTSLQDNYSEEMKRLAGKVKGAANKMEGSAKIKGNAFRQGILDVAVDLSPFPDDLDSQVEGSSPSKPDAEDLTQEHNPSSSHQHATPAPTIPLETVIKNEAGSLKATSSGTRGQAEESPPDQDPLSPENDDPIDIEHVVYSEDLTKREPLPVMEASDDESNFAAPVVAAAAATSSVSRIQPGRNHGGKNARFRHACQFCGKRFTVPAVLKRHVYTHTGERPFQCHLCPMTFTQTSSLNRHLMMHSGKKPFTCPRCGKGFTRRQTLDEHKKKKICKNRNRTDA